MHEVPPSEMADWVESVVEAESPVHLAEIASRVAGHCGVHRVGHRIQAAVDRGATYAARQGRILQRGDFLWAPRMESPPVRDRSGMPNSTRKIERVAPEEIAEALILVVERGIGVTPPDAVVNAARMLGYARVTENIKGPIETVIQGLLSGGRLREANGYLVLP